MSRLHLSLDDTKGIFKALISADPDSIFDTRTLSYLEEMHNKYGSEFTMYCTCSDEGYRLSEVPGKYRREFINNSGWLHFGFHCICEQDEIRKTGLASFAAGFSMFEEQIYRIAGQKGIPILRLHGFQGDREVCTYLKEKGVDVLLCSDDDRKNYCLDEDQSLLLQTQRYINDEASGMRFWRSCTRLENTDSIVQELENRRRYGDDLIPVFSHEWQMDDGDIRRKIEDCCRWGAENCGN